MIELTVLGPALTIGVAYVYATLAPGGEKLWRAPLFALVPAVTTLLLIGTSSVGTAGAVWLIGTVGLWPFEKVETGRPRLAAWSAAVVLIGVAVAWMEPLATVPSELAAFAVIIAGLIITVEWGGTYVGDAIAPFTRKLYGTKAKRSGEIERRGLPKGFADGGKTIGRWERMLIFLFVLADAPTAIGFLVTAKSILRFGEIKDREHQKEAEYILIGTLMSFGFALVVSYLTRLALFATIPELVHTITLDL